MTKFSPGCIRTRPQRGFTLMEAVIVIVITGIVASMVAVFLKKPVDAYFDATRRATLSDEADFALRRITRDLRLALPNSVRVTSSGTTYYLEFLLTKGGGRYRANKTTLNTGNVLDFVNGSASFDVIGAMPPIAVGDQIVVFNLGPNFGTADAYQTGTNNRATVASASSSTITLTATKTFPNESPGKRFQVLDSVVSYVCVPNAANPAAGTLTRYWGYTIQATQPTTFSTGSSALLAANVETCSVTYDPNQVGNFRNGVVSLNITLTTAGEKVSLFQEAHVSNVP